MKQMLDAYLDIETTGLSWLASEITVIGIYLVNDSESRLVQPFIHSLLDSRG